MRLLSFGRPPRNVERPGTSLALSTFAVILRRMFCLCQLACFIALASALNARAAEVFPANTNAPGGFVAAEAAIKGFELPPGFKCELVAADPLLANPVCFSLDELGRFFVVETHRFGRGVPDIRERMDWLDIELASRSVEERVAYTRRLEPDNLAWWTNHADRVRLLWDKDSDGRCDTATVFAGDFNGLEEGLAAGVLAHRGSVYFANIPNLWLLRDTNADNHADVRKVLSTGYGVRYGFLGHDLHGLILGPDGKLYFSIGDRGARVTLPNDKVLDTPETGAIYRCDRDGKNLELFHTGLRNPQELAFDDQGNLWTVDNNSDGGDPARVVYVAEGGDSGWHVGWQFLERPIQRGAWLGERLCYEDFPGRAAYALPPVSSKVGNGPSGLAFDPGLGLPPEWRGRFFLANFSGNPNSGIYAFKVRPKGAGFELERNDRFCWNLLPTDVEFGYDGCLYVSDWINGWGGTGGGRLYRLYQPAERSQPSVVGLKQLMAAGFDGIPNDLLGTLLAHQDRRVRQEAQFELVSRKAIAELFAATLRGTTLNAKLHAIWGLGQLARRGMKPEFDILLLDRHPEVRAQAAKALGDAKDDRFNKQLIRLLTDAAPRVRYFAALSLGKLEERKALAPVLAMLRASGNDPWLRHAGVMALLGCAKEDELVALAKDESLAVRLAAVVALRRNASPRVEVFLTDANPLVVAEAARAINDPPIVEALPALAAVADQVVRFAALPAGTHEQPSPRDAILRRIVNANRRIGSLTAELRLASLIADIRLPEAVRAEAVTAFNDWPKPDGKDRITGLWRPLLPRSEPEFSRYQVMLERTLARGGAESVQRELLGTAARWRWRDLEDAAYKLFQDERSSARLRVAVLDFLGAVKSARLNDAVKQASTSGVDELRFAATRFAMRTMTGPQLVEVFTRLLNSGTLRERQGALALLGDLKDPSADKLLAARLDDLLLGKVPADLQLDVLEAAAKRADAQVKEKLGQFRTRQDARAGWSQFSDCLAGGDAENGKRIFRENLQAACLRCHKVNGEGGEAAPDLTKIGFRGNREYILESITFPNARIASGFENIQVVLHNGTSAAGIVKRETETELDLYSLEDGLVTLRKADIKSRTVTMSGMPDNIRQILKRREIRDLVEYLAGLQ